MIKSDLKIMYSEYKRLLPVYLTPTKDVSGISSILFRYWRNPVVLTWEFGNITVPNTGDKYYIRSLSGLEVIFEKGTDKIQEIKW